MKKPLLSFRAGSGGNNAVVRVFPNETGYPKISQYITGKFCEHLGHNIYNGMHAEILHNPTFADFVYGGGGGHPDGGTKYICDETAIANQIRNGGKRFGFPDLEKLVESRADGLAHFWIREGARDAVKVSPDAAPPAARAQRVEVSSAGQGIAQWVYLPLHRTCKYEWRIAVRSPNLKSLTISIFPEKGDKAVASVRLTGLSREWKTFKGKLSVETSAAADAPYRFVISAPGKGQFVISRTLLYPSDHVKGADPDVIKMLKESHLPLLRWPGGNFVSGYFWKDGIGPVDERPTRPNPAWGGLEPNLFGTDEFVDFCRAVGCEPMICINAASATPEEAAEWVEYCNGSAKTPMGRLRAADGHAKSFNIRFWEIGNELTGRHQIGWTTPAGYSDRYREYVTAMRKADSKILFLACGGPIWWKEGWNERLYTENTSTMRCITDHILQGPRVPASTDPLDYYRDSLLLSIVYAGAYAQWRETMEKAGVKNPRLAITELQLFGGILTAKEGETVRLKPDNLVNPGTFAEGVYDLLYYHMAVRLGDFVELFTHSATVNHGGGLRKEKERVYANPCHYAQGMFSALAGASPVPVELSCAEVTSAGVVKSVPDGTKAPVLDIVAARADSRTLLVSIVSRGTETVDLSLDLGGFAKSGRAELVRLSAEVPWAVNTLASPKAVAPVSESADIVNGKIAVTVPPFTIIRLTVSRK